MPRIPLAMFVVVGTAATSAHAGFAGWTGYVRSSGGYVMLDIFAGVTDAQDHLLNVFGMQVSTTGATFYQAPGLATKAWSPYFGNSSMDSADSFVTLGVFESTGTSYAASATAGDPDFAGYSPTLASAPTSTSHSMPDSIPAVNTCSLPQNPAAGGMPATEKMSTSKPSATAGFVFTSPLRSATVSIATPALPTSPTTRG